MRAALSHRYSRTDRAAEPRVSASRLLEALRARLGPFASPFEGARLLVNGKPQPLKAEQSGDSWWVWADLGRGVRRADCRIEAR